MKIGLIGAMTVEVEALKEKTENKRISVISGVEYVEGTLCGKDVVLAVAGVGKVNAGICAQTMILKFSPDVIINTGVAGGIGKQVRILDVVVATSVAQHDMDTSPLGDPVGFITGINKVTMDCDADTCDRLCAATEACGVTPIRGMIVSGDQFIGSKEQIDKIQKSFDAMAVEMEGGAIGQVCTMNGGVPFAVVRAISDGGDDEANMNYPQFVKVACARSVDIICAYLTAL